MQIGARISRNALASKGFGCAGSGLGLGGGGGSCFESSHKHFGSQQTKQNQRQWWYGNEMVM